MSVSYQGMLALLRELVGSPDLQSLLTAALEGALRLVPGAQAGSVLVQVGHSYRFVALRGHDIYTPTYELSLEDELRWYGGTLQEAVAALPKLNMIQPALSGLAGEDRVSLRQIVSVLTIPIPLRGEIAAWLCLDRMESSPFPEEALPLAHELGRSLGVVLQTLKERQNTQARLKREERLARVLGVLSTFREAELLWQSLPHLMLEILDRTQAVALKREGEDLVALAGANWFESLGRRIPRGRGVSWVAVEQQRVQMVPMSDPRISDVLGLHGFRDHFALSVPVLDAHGEGLGVVMACSPKAFDPEDAAVLESFGRGVGQVLARLEAQAAQARELTRLQTLTNTSQRLTNAQTTEELLQRIVQEALEQTKASTSLVTLYRPKDDVLEVVAAAGHAAEQAAGTRHVRGKGLAWQVLGQRSSLYLSDVFTEASVVFASGSRVKAAYLGVPLGDPEGRTVGVLSVDTAGTGGEIQLQDRYALEALAKVAGVMLSRLQALEQAYQQTDNYQALVQMSTDLEVLDDPQTMARRAIETLLGLTGLHAGGVFSFRADSEDLQSGHMELQVQHGLAQTHERFIHLGNLPVRIGEDFMGKALATGQTQRLDDYQTWEEAWPRLKDQALRTAITTPLQVRGQPYGALTLVSFNHKVAISEENISLLESVARRLERAWERVRHLEEITRTREDALRSLGLGLELRDLETKGHTDRVVALSEALGQRLGFADLEGLRMGAYLHDLGKLAIPDSILLKPGTLTDAEWRIMQSHCDIGFGMLENLGFLTQTARNIVRYHHERVDGSGYPFGLTRDEIPLEARLFAVVDVFDALLQSRPYKAAWSQQDALRELRKQAGDTLDAYVVQEFIVLIGSQVRVKKGS